MSATAAARFFAKVEKSADCWNWTGHVTARGYGSFGGGGSGNSCLAHRWSYEHAKGPIPDGLQVDHLCFNRTCVNPAHLEAVTGAENTRRAAARLTACKYGHAFTPDNLVPNSKGKRMCRACRQARDRIAYRAAHPEVIRVSRFASHPTPAEANQ